MNVCWWYGRKKGHSRSKTQVPPLFARERRERTTPDFDRATHSQRHVGSDVAQEEEKINQRYMYCLKKKKHLHNIHQWGI